MKIKDFQSVKVGDFVKLRFGEQSDEGVVTSINGPRGWRRSNLVTVNGQEWHCEWITEHVPEAALK